MGEVLPTQQTRELLISESTLEWADSAWQQIVNKVEKNSKRIGVSFPHASVSGVYDNMRPSWWTAGFWPGILWQIAAEGNHPALQEIAEQIEEKLDEPLYALTVHHDAGFIWTLSALANYRVTGNERSKQRGLMAAAQLASRFNLKGSFIRAWHDTEKINRAGWSIIDTVMNLPLLYWASEVTEDPRFRHIAAAHAETVVEHFYVRMDQVIIFCSSTRNQEKNRRYGRSGLRGRIRLGTGQRMDDLRPCFVLPLYRREQVSIGS